MSSAGDVPGALKPVFLPIYLVEGWGSGVYTSLQVGPSLIGLTQKKNIMNTDSYESADGTGTGSMAKSGIIHRGVVESWQDGMATVRVTHDSEGGCAACGAREGCGLAASGGGKPMSEVDMPWPVRLEAGQRVEVLLGRNSDWKATGIAFGLPVVLMIGSLIIGKALGFPELPTAFMSLGMLVLYGLILFLLRSRLKKTFSMTIISVE